MEPTTSQSQQHSATGCLHLLMIVVALFLMFRHQGKEQVEDSNDFLL